MANNRMWFRCTECDDRFPLAKYYPSDGWYVNRKDANALASDLDAWFEDHKHWSLFGGEIVMGSEIAPPRRNMNYKHLILVLALAIVSGWAIGALLVVYGLF